MPAYLRFVNRKAGGFLAALGHAAGLTPTSVTVISTACSFSGIAILILHDASVVAGVAVSLLLLLGYALDSADGQLARVQGGGSRAGEWLDHVADIVKITTLHSAVAISMLRFFDLQSWWPLAAPVVFLVANVSQFFGMMLRDKLVATGQGPRAARAGGGSSSVAVAWVLLPLDHGTLCLAMLTLGAHAVFLWCYAFLGACTAAFAVRSLARAYRQLLALDRTDRQG
ncbi:CDP-alcohol phosphatidyltransferase family protein [Nocardioides panacis]|uniref:CDP-alcohol phosphatidyltransferase family protein n=1 Tax=Nocardioides panacis TaxID=2849501 RepID=A0A975SYN3_9ACTN|nr:CDP-alcohol phosphatidyltransferase family protein [Nocardioides panacis]QWZ08384.1 CDP-alcohol phosphatidyltransferase family protein [Nocardioides panacis]